MYRALIVDDDSIICTGLQKLIDWQEYDFIAEDYALNGADALIMLEKTSYDLVITDIRMPKTDGIDLVRAMQQRGIPAKVIILSGYRDFEYAQTALELGVKKYILKPVNEKILVSALTEIKSEIEENLHQKLVLSESRTILLEKLFLELLRTGDTNGLIQEKLKGMGVGLEEKTFRVCVIEPEPGAEGIVAISPVVKRTVEEIIGRYSAGVVAEAGNNRLTVLLWSDAKSAATTRKICEEISERLIQYAGFPVHLAVGSEAAECSQISLSYQSAADISLGGFFSPDCRIVFQEDRISHHTIENIIRYVRDNCTERLTLQSIANHFFFNPAYIGRIFKNHTGMKFNEFLIGCRIEKSVQLMENSSLRVRDIAEKVGYTDYDHFCRVFRSHMSLTPSEYKARRKT